MGTSIIKKAGKINEFGDLEEGRFTIRMARASFKVKSRTLLFDVSHSQTE
jgi:hypothetical protein